MKNRNYIIRLIGVLVMGLLLVKLTYQFKYSTFLFDSLIFGGIAIFGFIFLIWSLIVDLKRYKIEKKLSTLIPLILGIVLTLVIWIWNWKINSNFNKPTLLRIYHDGDFNGTGIDFKTDGTYIFDNFAIGFSDYKYGTYEINENQITLDSNELDNVIKTNQLEIRPIEIEYSDRTEIEKYVRQVDESGNTMNNETEFRLVIDNRNK